MFMFSYQAFRIFTLPHPLKISRTLYCVTNKQIPAMHKDRLKAPTFFVILAAIRCNVFVTVNQAILTNDLAVEEDAVLMKCAESWSKICIRPVCVVTTSDVFKYKGIQTAGLCLCDERPENRAKMAFGPVFKHIIRLEHSKCFSMCLF